MRVDKCMSTKWIPANSDIATIVGAQGKPWEQMGGACAMSMEARVSKNWEIGKVAGHTGSQGRKEVGAGEQRNHTYAENS